MKKRNITRVICIAMIMTMVTSFTACKNKPKESDVMASGVPSATKAPERTAEHAFNDAIAVVKTRLSGYSLEKENVQEQLNNLKEKQIKDLVKVNKDMKMDIKFTARIRADREIDEIKVLGGFASDADNQAVAMNIGAYTNDESSLEGSLLIDLNNAKLYISDAHYNHEAYVKNEILDDSEWLFADFKDLFEAKIADLTSDLESLDTDEGVVDSAKEELNQYFWMFDLLGDDEVATEEDYEEIIKKLANFEWSNTRAYIKDNLKFTGTTEDGQATFEKKFSEMVIPVLKDAFELTKVIQVEKSDEDLTEMEEGYNTSLKDTIDFLVKHGDPKFKFTANFSEVEGQLQNISINLEIDKIQLDEEGESKISNFKLTYALSMEDQTLVASEHMKNNGENITDSVNELIESIKEYASPREPYGSIEGSLGLEYPLNDDMESEEYFMLEEYIADEEIFDLNKNIE